MAKPPAKRRRRFRSLLCSSDEDSDAEDEIVSIPLNSLERFPAQEEFVEEESQRAAQSEKEPLDGEQLIEAKNLNDKADQLEESNDETFTEYFRSNHGTYDIHKEVLPPNEWWREVDTIDQSGECRSTAPDTNSINMMISNTLDDWINAANNDLKADLELMGFDPKDRNLLSVQSIRFSRSKSTPIAAAVRHNHLQLFQWLLRHPDVHNVLRNFEAMQVLVNLAAANGHVNTLKILRRCLDLVYEDDTASLIFEQCIFNSKNELSTLILACSTGNLETVRWLFNEVARICKSRSTCMKASSVNCDLFMKKSYGGYLPLRFARFNNQLQICKWVILNGAGCQDMTTLVFDDEKLWLNLFDSTARLHTVPQEAIDCSTNLISWAKDTVISSQSFDAFLKATYFRGGEHAICSVIGKIPCPCMMLIASYLQVPKQGGRARCTIFEFLASVRRYKLIEQGKRVKAEDEVPINVRYSQRTVDDGSTDTGLLDQLEGSTFGCSVYIRP